MLKVRRLIKPLAKETIKQLVKKEASAKRVLTQIGLLVKLITISKEKFTIDLPAKAIQQVKDIKAAGQVTDLENYTLSKFIKLSQ